MQRYLLAHGVEAGYEPEVFNRLKSCDYITEDTIIIVEASQKTDFDFLDDEGFEIYKTKVYKTNKHVFIRRK